MVEIRSDETAVRVSVGIQRPHEPSLLVTPRGLALIAMGGSIEEATRKVQEWGVPRRIQIASDPAEVASSIPIRISTGETCLLAEVQPLAETETHPFSDTLVPTL